MCGLLDDLLEEEHFETEQDSRDILSVLKNSKKPMSLTLRRNRLQGKRRKENI